MTGRDRRTDKGEAGTGASRFHPGDDDCLWTGGVFIEAGSEWAGCGDGAQAVESERLRPNFLLGNIESRSIFGRLELVDLIGCGGRI